MLALAMTTGASAQQKTESEPVAQLRGCRVGTPNPQFKPRRAPLLQGSENPYIGNRRQLVVLVSFQDQDFMEDHETALQKWDKIFNTENYTEDRFVGSIHDYFMAQSYSSDKKRYHIFPANNKSGYSASRDWAYPYFTKDKLGNKTLANDCLTNTSEPAATLNNPNTDGELLMSKPITCMSVDANGLASFVFMDEATTSVREVPFYQEWGYDASTPMYDLQGRRLSAPAKGLYILGNKLRIKK